MKALGFCDEFINCIKMLYLNINSKLKINNVLGESFLILKGVRQGCPLSALLYVLVIEVFALQLRCNPNIVGFTIGGEKIISTHYLDDTTIIIKQNRCFKEVIKEINEYEEASGAKINCEKTKGLWTGSWKNRRVLNIDVKWKLTNKNVKSLGVYFGNDKPENESFNEIIPEIIKVLNYWKQFKITNMGKARIVEMFLISKLITTLKFYTIPQNIQEQIQREIVNFVNYPECQTIAQKEMWKRVQEEMEDEKSERGD